MSDSLSLLLYSLHVRLLRASIKINQNGDTRTGTTMAGITYNYTVKELLHEAGRHRRSDHCGPKLENCKCEDDHVIELRLVVKALNQLRRGTYRHDKWQTHLVDFFNAKHRNEEQLPHEQHLEKTHAVDKWMQGEHLSHIEMHWINIIRDVWRQSRSQLRGFEQFKLALSSVLRMS